MENREQRIQRPQHEIVLEQFEFARDRFERSQTHGAEYLYTLRTRDLLLELKKPGMFDLGDIAWTDGARAAMHKSSQMPAEFLVRHLNGDHGLLDAHDVAVNREAMEHQGRILSMYETKIRETLMVITEGGWQSTTLLLPSEY